MRFLTVAALLFGSAVLAAPTEQDSSPDKCCCCDISAPVVRCKVSKECICAKVKCPDSAPTIWLNTVQPTSAPERRDPEPEPAPAPIPAPVPQGGGGGGGDDDDDKCCCCSPQHESYLCRDLPADETCMCPAIACPPEWPSISVYGDVPLPTNVPEDPCCCCDSSEDQVVCNLGISQSQCRCAAVECSSDAPTVTVWKGPAKTVS